MPGVLRQSVISKFEAFGLKFQVDLISGFLLSNGTDLAVVIDINITDLNNPFDYNDYTEEQNAMMFEYEKLFRFSIDSELEIDIAVEQLSILLEPQEQDVDLVFKSIHSDRSIQAIDPTTPEAYFEQAFISAYGRENLKCVSREMPIIDIYGKTRFVDYYIEREGQNVAIEKNGVRYHHPQIIGKQRYQSQLVKQNSIVSSGCKLYRWSLEAFKFIERFLDELKSFIGPADNLKLAQKISVKRDFELYEFQENSLGKLRKARKNNIKAGLVVLPTGTGKTEILVSEVASEIHNNQDARLLILCPSRKIKFQNINTLKDRLLNHKSITISDSICNNVVVQTYAWFSRHYREIDRKYFTYIAVDEAHHAVAPTMRAALRHFDPSFILGLTATDKRLDSRKLEDVFGNYDVDLSLREAIENGYLAPIRAFRIKSNVDLSEVRFNGKDYVTSDLQKNILIPSRDQLIVNVLLKYFSGNQIGKKSGVIFCVSIRHAKSLAERLCLAGFTAKAVCGKDSTAEQYTKEYENGDIQFLTTCSLLTEGWNCHRTSII